jgi:hypothetical protein
MNLFAIPTSWHVLHTSKKIIIQVFAYIFFYKWCEKIKSPSESFLAFPVSCTTNSDDICETFSNRVKKNVCTQKRVSRETRGGRERVEKSRVESQIWRRHAPRPMLKRRGRTRDSRTLFPHTMPSLGTDARGPPRLQPVSGTRHFCIQLLP